MAFIYIISILASKIKKFRYFLIFILTFIYVLFQRSSSDYLAYEEYFHRAAQGGRVNELEPVYPTLAKIWGILFSSDIIFFPIFVFTVSIVILLGIKKELNNSLKNTMYNRDKYLFFSILCFYIVVYQVAFNFRGGFATLFFTLAFLLYKQKKLVSFFILTAITILTHVQTLPVLFFLWGLLVLKNKKVMAFAIVLLLLMFILFWSTLYGYIFKFIISQGSNYLSSYSGTMRVASIPYIIIDLVILIRSNKEERSELKMFPFDVRVLAIFHLLVQLIFFNNSHISSRLVKPIEPILLCGLFYVLNNCGRRKIERYFSYVIAYIPGFSFVALQLLTSR